MTTKLVVLYTQPDDPEAFDRHYLDVHGPLVDKIPGLRRWSGARFTAAADGGETPWYRVAELEFADQAAFQAGMGSPEGKATAKDFQQIAPPGSQLLIAVVD
jgi:uncharacterized protein (TIGR02118 family)